MSSDELLQQLQSRGLITEAIAARLKRDAIVGNELAEDIIEREQIVPDEQLASLKSELIKVPYKKIDPNALTAELMGVVPEETARTYHAVPISLQDGLLVVGMLHPDDPKAQEAMKFIARQNHFNLGVYLVSYGDLAAALRKYSPYRAEVEAAVRSLNVKNGSDVHDAVELEGGDSADAPIIKIVADTFKEAVLNKASDVHIEPQQKSLRIRLRIDGDLREVASMPVELAQPITSRIKVISSLKIDENRVPQDGRFRAKLLRSRYRLPRRHVSDAARREDRHPRARSHDRPQEISTASIFSRPRARSSKRDWKSRSAWCSSPAPPVPERRRRSIHFSNQ
jgi:hypothetical protein